jgi:hypothetical protein
MALILTKIKIKQSVFFVILLEGLKDIAKYSHNSNKSKNSNFEIIFVVFFK